MDIINPAIAKPDTKYEMALPNKPDSSTIQQANLDPAAPVGCDVRSSGFSCSTRAFPMRLCLPF